MGAWDVGSVHLKEFKTIRNQAMVKEIEKSMKPLEREEKSVFGGKSITCRRVMQLIKS